MVFYTGNPLDDAADYYASEKEEIETTHRCEVDGKTYYESEMVENKRWGEWIFIPNIDEYLANLENDMMAEDLELLKINLQKQIEK